MITFIDMDGVIIDSIEECYMISKEAYYKGNSFKYDEDRYKKIFFNFRGFVRPPYEYFCLHQTIEHYYYKDISDSEFIKFFIDTSKNFPLKSQKTFEENFFSIRYKYQDQDFESWIKMNPLTSFGKTLKDKQNLKTFIITTKDYRATKLILEHYNISVDKIYSNEDIKNADTKGHLIADLMDIFDEQEGLFIDDSVEHLNTVKDQRIKCYFADWGYGKNTDYPIYSFKKC